MEATSPLDFLFFPGVSLRVWPGDAWMAAYFLEEYGWHRVARLKGEASVVLDTRPPAPDHARTHHHKVLARWRYTARWEQGRWLFWARGNRFAVPMIHHMLIHPALRWQTAYHGGLMLHAAAVVRNGSSLLLTGPGGAGKTTTASRLLATGRWHFHADDYVFLEPNTGTSHAYVTRSHLYLPLLRHVPEVKARLGLRERLALVLFGYLRTWSREGLKWPVRVPVRRLWPQAEVMPRARVAALVWLENGDSPGLVPVSNPAALVPTIIAMNFYEARHFLRLLHKAGALTQEMLEQWKTRETLALQRLLRQVPVYRFVRPRHQDAGAHLQSLSLLEALVP